MIIVPAMVSAVVLMVPAITLVGETDAAQMLD
jgi:hypothetical protein